MTEMRNYREEDEGIDLNSFNKEEEINIFKNIETKGFQLLVRLYVPNKKTKSGIIIASEVHDRFQYQSCVGLVVQKGPSAYGKRFDFLKDDDQDYAKREWCQVGDWVVFARHEGIQMKINGKPCQFLNDSSILAVIDNPDMIIR